jgi:hypothetical protein
VKLSSVDDDGNKIDCTNGVEQKSPSDQYLSIFKLCILGILWCAGSPIEKAQELYLTMVPGHHDNISVDTRLFKKNILTLIEISTEIALDLRARYMGKERTIFTKLTEKDKIKLIDEIMEEFHESVFGD